MVFIPHFKNEIFLNITNIQWILSILLIITLMKEEPSIKYGNINIQFAFDFIIIIFCGLTGPLIIFFIPLFLWKSFQHRCIYNYSATLLATLISLIQISFILGDIKESQDGNITLTLSIYSQLVGYKTFGNLFLGEKATHFLDHYLLSAMYFGLIYIMLRYAPQKKIMMFFLYVHLTILLAVFYKFRANLATLVPPGNGERYFYIPYIMIAWSLITLLGQTEKWKWKYKLIAAALIFILLSSLSSGFRSKFIDYNWKFYSKSIGYEDVVIPINPEGWQIDIKAHK